MKIEVTDHVIIGNPSYSTLRGFGVFSVALDNAEHTGRFFKTLRDRPLFHMTKLARFGVRYIGPISA
jgi:hypothetical protein